jgi:hypothetical protein
MIFEIVSPKNLAKKAFFAQNYIHTASFLQKVNHNIGLRKTPFFSPKIGKNRRNL